MRSINLKNFKLASSQTARDINRRIVLNIIRTRQPLSRADVSRLTGLQRSTVSLIVDQLLKEGWIVEGEQGRLPRGRRPTYLELNASRIRVVGVNVRPSETTIALSDVNAQFLSQETFDTPEDPKVFVNQLCRSVRAFLEFDPELLYEGIGVSLPGRVDKQTQRLAFAPNLGWHDVDIKTPLEQATGLSVDAENAANACALAEVYFGRHANGAENLVALAVSEGIGTGIITNGQLVTGPSGLAGEFGHISIDADGPLCRCGNHGCWEVFASEWAAMRYYSEAASAKPRKGSAGSALPPEHSTSFSQIVELAVDRQDSRAREALEKMAYYLGVGMSVVIRSFTPSVLLVIGEVTRAWPLVEPIMRQAIEARAVSLAATQIVPTEHELQPRLQGAVALVLQKHFGAPQIA